MTELYLIRHGEAEGNAYRRAHGSTNSLLMPNGWAQLPLLAERMRDVPLSAVYVSDLFRAYHTGKAVADVQGLSVQPDARLREIDFGLWEDRPWAEIAFDDADSREAFARFEASRPFAAPGGESREHALGRIRAVVADVLARHEGQSVALATHSCLIKYYFESIGGEPLKYADNASVSLVCCEGNRPELLYYGDNTHLGERSTFTRRRASGASRAPQLYFRPVDPKAERTALVELGRRAFVSVYGDDGLYDVSYFLHRLEESAATDHRFVQYAYDGDEIAGFLQLRSDGEVSAWDLHIPLLFLEERYRGRGIGPQLVGEAVSLARRSGKRGLTLNVWEQNTRARRMYDACGFHVTRTEQAERGRRLLMQMSVRVPQTPPVLP